MAGQTYVAMLRAINLGSRNRIKMPDLVELFVGLKSTDVKTYVQSGNVVFRNPMGKPGELAKAIEERITDVLELDVRVLLRTRKELEALVAGSPFADVKGEPGKVLHVTVCDAVPAGDRADALSAMSFAPDELRVVGRDVYLHCPNGYGRSKLSNAFLEKRLGVVATTRNWKTVTTLAEIAAAG